MNPFLSPESHQTCTCRQQEVASYLRKVIGAIPMTDLASGQSHPGHGVHGVRGFELQDLRVRHLVLILRPEFCKCAGQGTRRNGKQGDRMYVAIQ